MRNSPQVTIWDPKHCTTSTTRVGKGAKSLLDPGKGTLGEGDFAIRFGQRGVKLSCSRTSLVEDLQILEKGRLHFYCFLLGFDNLLRQFLGC